MQVVFLLDAEDRLARLDPPSALEGWIHPDDVSADQRSNVDFSAGPHRSGTVHGDGPGAGHNPGGLCKRDLGWWLAALRFGCQRHQINRNGAEPARMAVAIKKPVSFLMLIYSVDMDTARTKSL